MVARCDQRLDMVVPSVCDCDEQLRCCGELYTLES